jgi:hypothetical protein
MNAIISHAVLSTLCGLFVLALMPFVSMSDADAVVRKPVAAACRTALVNGVWVRRCV